MITESLQPYCGNWLYINRDDAKHLFRVVPSSLMSHLDEIAECHYVVSWEPTDHSINDHAVIQMPMFPFQIRINEVPTIFALDVFRAALTLNIQLMDRGLVLAMDEKSFLWWNGEPIFVDLNSILPKDRENSLLSLLSFGRIYHKYIKRRPVRNDYSEESMRKAGGWPARNFPKDPSSDRFWIGWLESLDSDAQVIHAVHNKGEFWDSESGKPEYLFSTMTSMVPEGVGRALVLGSAGGQVARLIRKHHPSAAVCGVDSDPSCVFGSTAASISTPNIGFALFGMSHFVSERGKFPVTARYHADIVVAPSFARMKRVGVLPDFAAQMIAILSTGWALIDDAAGPSVERILRHSGMRQVAVESSPWSSARYGLWKFKWLE